MVGIYPWQTEQWRRLTAALAAGHLGHALLFSGREGVGHAAFAQQFAKLLLCEQPKDDVSACGQCRGCGLFDVGNHPDFMSVAPLEEGKAIGVDQIRELPNFYALKPHYGGRKVAIISAAEAMNRASSNALLKTLEEPPAGAVIILVTERYDALSMTIRSRCHRSSFEHIDQAAAASWLVSQVGSDDVDVAGLLGLSNGAPLLAIQYLEEGGVARQQQLIRSLAGLLSGDTNPMSVSRDFEGMTAAALIDELVKLMYLLIVHKSGTQGTKLGPGDSINRYLKACINGLNFKDLYAILDVVFDAKRQAQGGTNPRDADLLDPIWLAVSEHRA